MAILKLSGSVGSGSAKGGLPHNQPDDVAKVRDRFVELGYAWLSGITTGKEDEFIRTIKLFQSICAGSGKVDKGDGRIDRHGSSHRWLAATNAPGWVELWNKSGIGWQSTPDLEFKDKKNSHTTTWMLERIQWAGLEYRARVLLSGVSDAPPLWIRDCSPAKGGNALGHKSHETGLDVDMRLPLLPPNTHLWTRLQGHNYTKMFHYEAALVQLEAIKSQMSAKNVWFNDPRFIKKKLCTDEPNHGNHYHVRIKPPERVDGIYM
jgi:hypothetical protein